MYEKYISYYLTLKLNYNKKYLWEQSRKHVFFYKNVYSSLNSMFYGYNLKLNEILDNKKLGN